MAINLILKINFFICIVILIFCYPASADIYRCPKPDGTIGITNMPTKRCQKMTSQNTGKEPDNHLRLTQVAKKMESAIKAAYSGKHFQTKCFFDTSIKCILAFPECPSDMAELRYIHTVQALTREISIFFASAKHPESFGIQSTIKMYGRDMLICTFYYSKDFDSLTPFYTVQ